MNCGVPDIVGFASFVSIVTTSSYLGGVNIDFNILILCVVEVGRGVLRPTDLNCC